MFVLYVLGFFYRAKQNSYAALSPILLFKCFHLPCGALQTVFLTLYS